MKPIIFLALVLVATTSLVVVASGEQQRILRRVIKSTPTASNLSRVRVVTTRSSGTAEKGAVSEISSKDAANFGQRSTNETSAPVPVAATKSKKPAESTTQQSTTSTSTLAPTTSTIAATSTSTSTSTSSSTTTSTTPKSLSRAASERQQQANNGEVELLASAPSSWQTMTAVEAPAAALIAAGTRPAAASSDLSSSSSSEYNSFASNNQGDFLRSSGVKGGQLRNFDSQSVDQTFSRLRQQSKTSRVQQQQDQQSFFYPQQQRAAGSKTSNYQATKTHWYQPSTTTPRPAPLVEEPQQQYEQQSEQYVEQAVEGAAPPGQAEPYAFDFKSQDQSGNGQYRKEESDKNGVVRGSYGYWSDGIYRQVNYVADENGFRAQIQSNEPGMKKDAESSPASVELRS